MKRKEATYEEVMEYCKPRCLVLVTTAFKEVVEADSRKIAKIKQIIDDSELEAWEVLEQIKEALKTK